MRHAAAVRVALVLHHASGYGRRAGVGVRRFAHGRPAWELRVWEPSLDRLRSLVRWRPHGVVAYLKDDALARRLAALRIPVVNLSQARDRSRFPLVTVDNRAVGRAAADYLAGLGGRRLAVVGDRATAYARLREEGFREAARSAAVFRGGDLGRWLSGLPKPSAVFACRDDQAYQVARRCADAGLLIPEEVALLGAENEEEAGLLSRPPLSTIAVPSETVGYEAAALLDRLLAGGRPPSRPVLVPPPPVIERESTLSGGKDPVVAAALAYIAAHAREGIGVKQVVAHVPASRRTLERRFLDRTGRTVAQHLRRCRALPVKRLLSETRFTLEEIARREGFHSAQHLSEFFRALEGCSPGAWRNRGGRHRESGRTGGGRLPRTPSPIPDTGSPDS